MPITNNIGDVPAEVDLIVCGGGTAGCTVASRLAQADPTLSVLLIEGGENNANVPHVQLPALLLQHQLPGSRTAIFWQGNKSENLAGRAPVVPTGGILGGGSSINLMLYSRAQGCDFDDLDMPGWSAKDVVPLMEKLETYHGRGNASHGHNGPVHISNSRFCGSRAQEEVLQAAAKLDYDIYTDLENPNELNNGWERAMSTITPEGIRADAASAHIHPVLKAEKHPNLHVLTETKVIRVHFDEDKRAVSVECTTNPQYLLVNDEASKRQSSTIKARKQIVLSSGACGTALLLQRSGVGNSSILTKASVPVVADVQGVGAEYDDHTMMIYPFATNLAPQETLDGLLSGRMSAEEAGKLGLLNWNIVDTHAKLRPTESEVEALGPRFKELWERDYRDKPSKPLMMMATGGAFMGDPTLVPAGQYLSVACYSGYDYSLGHLYITGANLEDPIDFDVGYFSDEDNFDIKAHIWAYKKMRTLMRTTNLFRGEVALGHPPFAEESKAACAVATDGEMGGVSKEPEYTQEDDAAIEKFLRANVSTTWHSMGTCPMRPQAKGGVVDAELNVYGVKGLKCVDLSIIGQVGANTNNTALLIGEKGAQIMIRELGLM